MTPRKIIDPTQSRAFQSGAGAKFYANVEEFLYDHKGERFTVGELWRHCRVDGFTRESSLAAVTQRWIYAGTNIPDDPWLHIHRDRAESRAFQYWWDDEARSPEKELSITQEKATLVARAQEATEEQALRLVERGSLGPGVKPTAKVLRRAAEIQATRRALAREARRLREEQREAEEVVTTNGHVEVEPTPEPTPEPDPILDPTPVDPQPVRMGDLLEVIGLTSQGLLARDDSGKLWRMVEA